jgi:hypothetical protein
MTNILLGKSVDYYLSFSQRLLESIFNGREDCWLQPSIPWKISNERLLIPGFAKNKGIVGVSSLEGLQPTQVFRYGMPPHSKTKLLSGTRPALGPPLQYFYHA